MRELFKIHEKQVSIRKDAERGQNIDKQPGISFNFVIDKLIFSKTK